MALQLKGAIAEGQIRQGGTPSIQPARTGLGVGQLGASLQRVAGDVAKFSRKLDTALDDVNAYNEYTNTSHELSKRVAQLLRGESDPDILDAEANKLIEEFGSGGDAARLDRLGIAGLARFKQLFTPALLNQAATLFAAATDRKQAAYIDRSEAALNIQLNVTTNTTGSQYTTELKNLSIMVDGLDPLFFPNKEQRKLELIDQARLGRWKAITRLDPLHTQVMMRLREGVTITYWSDESGTLTQNFRDLPDKDRDVLLALANSEVTRRNQEREAAEVGFRRDANTSADQAQASYYTRILGGDFTIMSEVETDPRLVGRPTALSQIRDFIITEQKRRTEGEFTDPAVYIDALIEIKEGITRNPLEISNKNSRLNLGHRIELVEQFYAQKARLEDDAYQSYFRSRREGAKWLDDRLAVRGIFNVIDPTIIRAPLAADIKLEYYQLTDEHYDSAKASGTQLRRASDFAPEIYNKYIDQGLSEELTVASNVLFTQIRPYLTVTNDPTQPLQATLDTIQHDHAAGEISDTQRLLYSMAVMDLERQGVTLLDLQAELGLVPLVEKTDKTTAPKSNVFMRMLRRLFEAFQLQNRLNPEPEN